tara:strand:+ start:732 stop:1013 length:282 start_codon:yes stop_codon:yes gene_type:complete
MVFSGDRALLIVVAPGGLSTRFHARTLSFSLQATFYGASSWLGGTTRLFDHIQGFQTAGHAFKGKLFVLQLTASLTGRHCHATVPVMESDSGI